jgi:mRNA interferase MazF
MKKGEIYLIEIPFLTGHEQAGFRPAIIFSNETNNMVMAIPLTGKRKALNYNYSLEIKPSGKNGLKETSYALAFQLRALDKRRVKMRLGQIEKNYLEEINNLVRKLLLL